MIKSFLKYVYYKTLKTIPFLRPIYYTRETQTPVTLKIWLIQKVIGVGRKIYWPVHFTSTIRNHKNIYAGIDTSPGYSPGCYIQGAGQIYIGDYTQIGPNVGIISANHDLYDNRNHMHSKVVIGKYCWIGMNSVILPGVVLGEHVIVGAGSVVTKSFENGYCIIGGNPAKEIKLLIKDQIIEYRNKHEYNGYINSKYFEDYKKRHLSLEDKK